MSRLACQHGDLAEFLLAFGSSFIGPMRLQQAVFMTRGHSAQVREMVRLAGTLDFLHVENREEGIHDYTILAFLLGGTDP